MRSFIDAHLHLFDIEQGKYEWLQPHNPPFWPDKQAIRRTFTQRDLIAPAGYSLDGIVHIEAGFDNARPFTEVDYLERSVSLPLRTVAGGDITRADFADTLARLANYKSVCGVRHILDEQAVDVLSHPNTMLNMQLLAAKGWHFEAQLPISNDKATRGLLSVLEKTGVKCIINHAGLLAGETLNHATWQAGLKRLAGNPDIAIKASGWEMMYYDRHWTTAFAADIITELLHQFGPSRVMLGSNFPLCLFSCDYPAYWQRLYQVLPASAYDALLFDNARSWYRFNQ